MKKLVQVIKGGMQKVNALRTQTTLGDRTEYIGASDLGQCPRKAVFEKVNPVSPDLATLIRFERGHLTENILSEALKAEEFKNTKRQMVLKSTTENGTPLEFHLDFVFHSKDGNRFAILETKSTTPVPTHPYEGWELQLHAQMGLAREILDKKIEVDGAIFALNMAPKQGDDPYGAWNGYKPNQDLWDSLRADADTIWAAVQHWKGSGNLPEDLPLRPGPLCGYCSCLNTCPAFAGNQADELAPQVEVLLDLQRKKKQIAQAEDDAKKKLKAILRDKGWVNVGLSDQATAKLKVNKKKSRRTDFKALANALKSYGDNLDNYATSSSYEELIVKTNKE